MNWLRALFSADCILELHSARFRLRDMSEAVVAEFDPILAIDRESRVVSVGRPVDQAAVRTFRPFDSPSALEDDRRIAEVLLQYAFSKLSATAWLKPSPAVVIHLPTDSSNLACEIDDRTLIQLSTAAGARKTVVHRGAALSAAEARRLLRTAVAR